MIFKYIVKKLQQNQKNFAKFSNTSKAAIAMIKEAAAAFLKYRS